MTLKRNSMAQRMIFPNPAFIGEVELPFPLDGEPVVHVVGNRIQIFWRRKNRPDNRDIRDLFSTKR